MKLLTCVAVLSLEGGCKAMSYFDITEAVSQRWSDQPSRNAWLVYGCDWLVLKRQLIGERAQDNPPPKGYVAEWIEDYLKSEGASPLAPYTTITASLARADVQAEVTLSGHVRDVYSAALSQCRESYMEVVLEDAVKDMVSGFFEEWSEWEGYL